MSENKSGTLQGDFLHQLLHVGNNAKRLLAMQDQDPCSPSFGCFHYAYWRDKTSEFPDARFQEAAAALGLLSLDVFDERRVENGWPAKDVLYASFRAGLRNLAHQQYPEGCYDEWYKGERGFAATAFTTCAFGIVALYLKDRIAPDDLAVLVRVLRQAGNWLTGREDVIKINHEIVGAAALAVLWKLTGEARWRTAAERKLAVSLTHQSAEGWFSELGGADLGYSALCIDYLMIYFWITSDARAKDAAEKLLGFFAVHLHPDMTVAAEAGTCRNAYVGQIGFLLLQRDAKPASAIVSALETMADSSVRISAYLSDDLRLARWAILPVLAAILKQSNENMPSSTSFPALYPEGWTVHEKAGLVACHRGNIHAYAAVAGGAVLRIYYGARLICEDCGLSIRLEEGAYSTRSYNPDRKISRAHNGLACSIQLEKMNYLFPGFLKRIVLRLGSVTPLSSRLMRALIDRYRMKNHTAVNQAAASVGGEGSRFILTRGIEVTEKSVCISDILRDAKGALKASTLHFDAAINGNPAMIELPGFAQAAELKIKKTITLNTADAVCEIEITHV